jgi:hypothetical protein
MNDTNKSEFLQAQATSERMAELALMRIIIPALSWEQLMAEAGRTQDMVVGALVAVELRRRGTSNHADALVERLGLTAEPWEDPKLVENDATGDLSEVSTPPSES